MAEKLSNTKVAICSLLVVLGIFSISYWFDEKKPTIESTEISQDEEYYDFNKSTDTVNHSSDIRYHRTMDTRPRDYDDTFESKGTSIPQKVNDEERVYFNRH